MCKQIFVEKANLMLSDQISGEICFYMIKTCVFEKKCDFTL